MKKLAALMAAVIAAVGITACSGHGQTGYDSICVDPLTQVRMPDSYCLVGGFGYSPLFNYWYVPYGRYAPAYGVHINQTYIIHQRPGRGTVHTGGISSIGGNASKPSPPKVSTPKQGSTYKAPTTGGTVRRGGSSGFSSGGYRSTGGRR